MHVSTPIDPVETTPIKTLEDHVLDVLAGTTPLDFNGVKKALKAGGVKISKKDLTEDHVASALTDAVDGGRAFKYASGAKGVERYWSQDEKEHIRETVLKVAAAATPFAKLHSAAKGLLKGTQAEFAEGIVRELIGEGKLHEHPPKKAGGPAQYATSRPKTHEEIEAEQRAAKERKAEQKRLEKEAKAAAEQRQKVLDAVATLGDDPVAETKLGKPTAKAGAAALAVYEEILKELLDAGKLFTHGNKYGKHPPAQPKWYDTPAYLKLFDKLLKVGAEVMKVDAQPASVVFAEMLARLNVSLSSARDLSTEVITFVERWASEHKAGCPFDKLYDHLAATATPPTIGQFHDLLRELDRTHRLRLSGWPKTLYDLPRGELALLRSDKVFYYANPMSWGE